MIDKSKNMRIKKELKSYISTFYDKISDKENEEMANKLLEKYNTDKDFNKRVEKIGKKLQSSTSTKSKKGGRRKTRKRQKGGMEDVSIAIIAASIIIGGALIYLGRSLRYGAERMGATVGSVASSMQLNRTPSSDDGNNSPPHSPPRHRCIEPQPISPPASSRSHLQCDHTCLVCSASCHQRHADNCVTRYKSVATQRQERV